MPILAHPPCPNQILGMSCLCRWRSSLEDDCVEHDQHAGRLTSNEEVDAQARGRERERESEERATRDAAGAREQYLRE